MIERQILQVVYSPFKAFESIVKNPAAKGPVLILVLGVIATAIQGYIVSSKWYVQLEPEVEQYVPIVTTSNFGGRMVSIAIDAGLMLSLVWFLFTGVLLLVIKVSGLKEGSWRVVFFVIGYTLMTSVVNTLVNALLFSGLPTVYLKWGVWNPLPGTEETAYKEWLSAHSAWFASPLYLLVRYLSLAVEGWTAALTAIAIHTMFETTWRKAVAVASTATILAYIMKIVLLSL